jgi:hypothetical protein
MDEPDPQEALRAKLALAMATQFAAVYAKNEHLREWPPALLVLAFARALAAGDAEGAYLMLTPGFREQFTPSSLMSEFEGMYSYASDTTPDRIEVLTVTPLGAEYEGKGVAAVFVGISGVDHEDGGIWNEAINAFVTEIEGRLLIRDIIWGRP